MDVQVIYHQGEPEYAVLPWAAFQQLLREAGYGPRSGEPPATQQPAAPTQLGHLRNLREEHNLTLEALAREAGISPSYLDMIERGEREPSAVLLRALGRIFNVQDWSV